MSALAWILIAFLSGSLPFSVWLGKIFLGLDVRQFGDGNPGATNVFRAGSSFLGVLALLLDVTKAALPVGFCYFQLGIRGFPMVMISLAPVLGHSFSPFLKLKGGKALATVLGVWIGLTTWQVSLPAVLGVLVGTMILSSTGWGVMFAMGVILSVLMIWFRDPLLIGVWAGQTILMAWNHRGDLGKMPGIHSRLRKLFRKHSG